MSEVRRPFGSLNQQKIYFLPILETVKLYTSAHRAAQHATAFGLRRAWLDTALILPQPK